MPPKKPFRRDNKKKNGKKAVVNKSAVADDGEHCGSFKSLADLDSDWLEPGQISTDGYSKSSPKGNKTSGRGLYGMYKRATQRFKESLMALVPANIFAIDRVQTIMDAVDYIVDQQQSVDPALLEDCRISLHFRKSYSKQFEDGGDEGHEYFILVLGYCFESLKPFVPQSKLDPAKENEKRFCFTDLDIESDDGEEELEQDEAENDEGAAHLVRPPEPEDEFTIEDLVESTDRCQACLFLFNVEKCMKVVAKKFAGLKRKARYLRDNGIDDPSYLIGPLMTCAAATNFSIRQVQLMEEELEVNLPHLSTFARVIACVFLKSGIDQVELIAREHGKNVPRCEATAFLGDVMEQVFRLPDDLLTTCCERLARAFCRKWSLPFDEIDQLGKAVLTHALIETKPHALQAIIEQLPDLPSSHQWLRNIKYTGGDRSIINTHAHVQHTAKDLSRPSETGQPQLHVAEGAIGSLWDERLCPAQKIQGDMDQLLREEILPELMLNCMYGALGKYIPRLDECLPLIKLLKDFVDNPAKSIPLSLTFGIHAILTSIYELQGDDDVATIAKAAENANNIYFDQIEELLNQPDFATHGIWPKDVKMLLNYRMLTASPETDERVLARAYWNPCCAGMFLTYVAFKVNMGVGSHCMNCLEQLRMILHLCNAFQQCGLAVEPIPLLTSLDNVFEGAQYVWWGEKPTRENILKRFLISYGVKADAVRKIHQDCRGFVIDKKPSSFERFHKTRHDHGETRSMRKVAGDCRPGDISKAYRKICLGDFDGMSPLEEWSTQEMDEDDWEWNMQYTRFLDDIMTAMDRDEELSSWNLTTLGCCLSGFLHFLSDRLGWRSTLEHLTAQVVHLESEARRTKRGQTKPDSAAYKGMAHAHAQSVFFRKWFFNHLLGPLEFLESIDDVPEVVAARDCLVEYFTGLDPAKYKIFNVLSDDIGWGQEEAETDSESEDLDSSQEEEADSEYDDEASSEEERQLQVHPSG